MFKLSLDVECRYSLKYDVLNFIGRYYQFSIISADITCNIIYYHVTILNVMVAIFV